MADNETPKGITKLIVGGFKAIRDTVEVDIRPLTILAGANSSGKSSLVQPLLMMKQTLESPYDAGALLLNGDHVKFTKVEQFWRKEQNLKIGFELNNNIHSFVNTFYFDPNTRTIELAETSYDDGKSTIYQDMSHEEILKQEKMVISPSLTDNLRVETQIINRHNLLVPAININQKYLILVHEVDNFEKAIARIIHITGLRGKPERTYQITAIKSSYKGVFEPYFASIINHWQTTQDSRLVELGQILNYIGLTNSVAARYIDDTQIELLVQHPKIPSERMISLADVGLGLSQVLPVLVALLVAEEGQLVYIEQPEIHLHPRAQVALGKAFADAAKRGVRVIVETHSSLFLLGIQTLVAQGELPPELVKLHWFSLNAEGNAQIDSHDLDENGAYGDWQVDFGDVELNSHDAYLTAVSDRMFNGAH